MDRPSPAPSRSRQLGILHCAATWLGAMFIATVQRDTAGRMTHHQLQRPTTTWNFAISKCPRSSLDGIAIAM